MKHLYKLSLIVLGICLFCTCNPELDVAPYPTFDGKANMTIAELVALHTITATNSYDTIPAGAIISGIVTTSDEHGNCYKFINIEDETGGIQIKIDNKALFNKYKVGQRVFVKCDGLVIGDYYKLPQLGLWGNDGMQPIPSNKVGNHIFCDSIPGSFEPTITMTTIPKADDIPTSWYNRLVKIENCTFVDGGQATYSAPTSATSHDIELPDGTTITMRTSNYADFINEMLPKGTGNVVGILTRYNNYVQIVIRDLDDVQGFTIPAHFENIFSVNYPNAFNDGWLKVTSGAEWQVLSNSSFIGFFINAVNSSATRSYLISPPIDLSNAVDPVLSFKHRAPNGGSENNMKCYYTTNFTGDISTTMWTPIPVNTFSTGTLDFNFELPAGAISDKFRIAFQYEGSGESWYINGINISAIITSPTSK